MKLLFKIKDNTIKVIEKNRLNSEYKSMLNTNVISCNEVVFSDEYIINNEKIVATFLKDLAETYGIDTLILDKNSFALIILGVLKNNKIIKNLILNEEEQLNFKLCEAIVKTNIKNIRCYNLQQFMIEYLDKYDCLVESKNELLFLSNFMKINNLNLFSSLFYKVSIQLDLPMSSQDEEDFQAFCKINKYLKIINVTVVNKNDLEFIIDVLRKCNKKNIRIVIRENIDDLETIAYLRNFNKKKSKKYKIHFKLEYSNEYLKKNFLKQTNNSVLKTCSYIIIIIIAFTFGYVFYDNYNSMMNVESIQDEIKQSISLEDNQPIIDDNVEKQPPIETPSNNTKPSKKVINRDVAGTYDINPDTVGWLTVPNTNIDYPVVKTTDNEYYLKHNIYFKEDKNGWVFMDYRNDVENLSDNIIVYAHNRYYSGVMFGTLQYALRKSWYTNPDNQIITLKTLYENLEYRIFSVYKIATTNDYMRTLFSDDEDRLNFYNMLKNRSINDFEVQLSGDDKIISLSTCADDYNRYVVHAVLVKKN